jgi:alkyl hydroperoxide reductase subunit AhpC
LIAISVGQISCPYLRKLWFEIRKDFGSQATDFSQWWLTKADADIYSVSEDTEFVHKAWAEASEKIGKIKYNMLADPAGKLARMFDVLDEDAGQAYRGVFIVDPDGKIQSYTINNMGIGRSADEILRTLQAAQFVREHGDRVCPANWKPGQDSIKPSLDLVGKL